MTLGIGNNRENSSTPSSSASTASNNSSSDTEYDCNNPQHANLAENYRRAIAEQRALAAAHQQHISVSVAHHQLLNVAFGRQQQLAAVPGARQQRANPENVLNNENQQGGQQADPQGGQQENQQGGLQENQQRDQQVNQQGGQQVNQQGGQQDNQQGGQQENQQGGQQENQQGGQQENQANKPLFDYDEMFEQYMQDRGYPYRDTTATPARQFILRQEEEMLRMTGLQLLGWDSPSDYHNRGRFEMPLWL